MSEEMYCPDCGCKMEETKAKWFCPNCGFRVPKPTPDLSRNFDWDAFRTEAAKDFMAAIITREAPQYNFACRNVADRTTEAIMWADELIKQLKERE